MKSPRTPIDDGIRGVALIEALVALLIMAFGMVALAGLQGTMRSSSDLAKQRGEAMRLAQQDLEQLRDYSVLSLPEDPPAGTQAYSDISNGTIPFGANAMQSNTNFTLVRTVTPANQPDAPLKSIHTVVTWQDRADSQQSLSFDSFVTRADPGLAASLSIAPDFSAQRRAPNRNSQVPGGAKDLTLDHKRVSVYKPVATGTSAWIFNSMTGVITSKCTVPADTATLALVASDVTACTSLTARGYLLQGHVRFATSSPPNPAAPNGTAMPLDMVLAAAEVSEPPPVPTIECYDNAPATAPSLQTVVSYACIVYPNVPVSSPLTWSAKLQLTSTNFTIGGAGGWNVCRYSADYDGNHAIGNAEHPLSYVNVPGSLVNQNFLVIPSTESCPAGQVADASASPPRFSNTQTVLNQPIGSVTPTPP